MEEQEQRRLSQVHQLHILEVVVELVIKVWAELVALVAVVMDKENLHQLLVLLEPQTLAAVEVVVLT
jgi:hypothetical protein